MSKKMEVKIGGVPEHFNLPWHLSMENGMFSEEDFRVSWQDFPGGTGAMRKALREGAVDIAIVLTEGIVADIVQGNPSKIVQQYVKSPLIWGIHTAVDAPFQNANELKGKKYAISRYGSGSHIMTFIDAKNRAWNPKDQQFELVGNLEGALKSLKAGESDAWLWEKFTTKPYVDTKEIKRIGECITPWPCFVMVVRDELLENHSNFVRRIMNIIQRSCRQFMRNPNAPNLVGWRYNLELNDAQNWFHQTEWATTNRVSKKMLMNVMHTLKSVGVIEEVMEPDKLCSHLCSFNEAGV